MTERTPWTIPDGDKTRQLKVNEIVECLQAAASLFTKEMEFNRSIKENPKMKRTYSDYVEIVALLRQKFETAEQAEKKVTPLIPRGKR